MDAYKGIITYVKPWEMEDERTGRIKRGITVEYLLTDTLKAVENDDGSNGYRHVKESLSVEKIDKIKEVPGLYLLKFTLAPGAKGKLSTKLDDVQFVESV